MKWDKARNQSFDFNGTHYKSNSLTKLYNMHTKQYTIVLTVLQTERTPKISLKYKYKYGYIYK